MNDFLSDSAFFYMAMTMAAFYLGTVLQKKTNSIILSPILTGSLMVVLLLLLLDIPVETYQRSCEMLHFLITPATICLVISFYKQVQTLKKHLPAVLIGVIGGTLSSLFSVWLLCQLFGLDEVLTASLLPKSVTSAIGAALSEQNGGIGALTTAVIVVTGILGNVIGPLLSKIFRLRDPVSQGVAYGTSSHIAGTSRAMEISSLCGAVSSLSLTLSGLITALLLSFL
jgi:putative effector of murein hydrolase